VGERVSQFASLEAVQFMLPPPEFQTSRVWDGGLIPPWVEVKVKEVGEKEREGGEIMEKSPSERSNIEGSSRLEILIRQAEEAGPVTTQDSTPSLEVEAKMVSHAPEG
jgi:hypothetical protein